MISDIWGLIVSGVKALVHGARALGLSGIKNLVSLSGSIQRGALHIFGLIWAGAQALAGSGKAFCVAAIASAITGAARLGQVLVLVGNLIRSVIGSGVKAVGVGIQAIASGIQALGRGAQAVGRGVQALGRSAVQAVVSLATNIQRGVLRLFGLIWAGAQALAGGCKALCLGAIAVVAVIVAGIGRALMRVADLIRSVIGSGVKAVGVGIQAIASGIQALGRGAQAVGRGVQALGRSAVQAAVSLATNIQRGVLRLFGLIWAGAQALAGGCKALCLGAIAVVAVIVAGIGRALMRVADLIRSVIGSGVKAVGVGIQAIASGIQALGRGAQAVGRGVQALGRSAVQAAVSLATNIQRGVLRLFGLIWAGAQALAGGCKALCLGAIAVVAVIVAGIGRALMRVADLIRSVIGSGVKAVGVGIQAIASGIQALGRGAQAVGRGVQALGRSAVQAAVSLATNIQRGVLRVFGLIWAGAQALAAGCKALCLGAIAVVAVIVAGIGRALMRVADLVRSVIGSGVKAVGVGIQAIASGVQALGRGAQAVGRGVQALGRSAVQAAVSLATNIQRGVLRVFGLIWAGAQALAGGCKALCLGAIAVVAVIVAGIGRALMRVADLVRSVIGSGVKAVGVGMQAIASGVQALGRGAQAVGRGVQALGRSAVQAAVSLATNIQRGVLRVFGLIWAGAQALAGGCKALCLGAIAVVAVIVAGIGRALMRVADLVRSVIGSGVKAVGVGMQAIASGVQALGRGAQAVGRGVQALGRSAVQAAVSLAANLQRGVLGLFSLIWAGVLAIVGGVTALCMGVVNGINAIALMILNGLLKIFNAFIWCLNLLAQPFIAIFREWRNFKSDIFLIFARIKEIRNRSDEKKIVGILSPFQGEKKTIVSASILINVLALAFPLLMLQLYDRILPQQSMSTLELFAIAVCIAVILESITRVARSYTTAWISARFEHKAMVEVAERVLAEPLHEFERKGTGAVMENFKSISTLKYHYSGQTFQQLMDLPFTFLYLSIIYILNIWLGVLLTVGYIFFIYITWKAGGGDTELTKEQKEADLRRSNFLNETLSNVHTLKSMSMESLMLRRYERLQESSARIMARMSYAMDMSSGIGNVFSPLMTTLVVSLGAWLVITHQLTNGELAACVLLGMRSLAPLQRLGGMWSKFQQDEVLRNTLAKTLMLPKLKMSHLSTDREVDEYTEKTNEPYSLDLRNIEYKFPGASKPIFKNLNLHVHPGECIAITGYSGSGRSILLQLMAGILKPSHGEILINNQDITHMDMRDIANLIAYLPQNSQMFEGSLLDNVSVFDASRVERALETAKLLGLDDFVSRMPRGWDSPVGDMATDSLPPGYRQRIAIVRALSNGTNIVLVDDPTATIDSEGDAAFRRFLDYIRDKVTLIIVSHRPSFFNLASRNFYLADGTLTEVKPNQLVSLSGVLIQPNSHSNQGRFYDAAKPIEPVSYTPVTTAEYFNSPLKRGHIDADRWQRTQTTVSQNFKSETDLSRCLTLLLKLLNSRVNAREVAESLPYFTESLDLSGFHNAMAQMGYKVVKVHCALGELDSRSLPCLFLPDDGFGFIAMGRVGKQIRKSVGEAEEIDLESNLGMIGQAFFYELVDTKVPDLRSWVFTVMRRFSPLIGQATISALVTGLVVMTGPLFIAAVYSTIIPSGAKDSLLYLALGSTISLASAFFFMRQRARVLSYIAGRIEYLFGATILQQVFKMSPAYTERASVGSQTSRLQSFESIRDLFIGPLASTLLESPATLILLIALSLINPVALIVFSIMVVIYCFLYKFFSVPNRERILAVSKTSSKRNEFLVEMISKMRSVRECGAEAVWLERFREISAEATMASFKAEKLSSLLVGISYFVMMFSALTIVTVTVPFVFSQAVASGALIASMMLMWRVLTPIQTIFTSMSRIERVLGSTRQIDSLMKIQGESQGSATSLVARGLEGSVEFSRVSFRYSMNVDPALVGAEFKLTPGEMVAISGPNGGGKSTLLKLLLGMYQPQAGSILIDNVDIRQLDPIELRRMIGYAPQDIQLFRATIAQNLRLARPEATDNELYQALDMAGALEQTLELPRGLEYRVGDNTNQLSASLKQKISLARAYLTRSPIMLFDEPSSSLDELGDRKFIDTMQALKGESTVIFISHRPSHILLADTLLVFDKGYLRAAGPPNELLKGSIGKFENS